MEIPENGWVSAKAASEILGLAYTTICKYINEGRLEAIKENGQWKVKPQIIEPSSNINTENSMDLHRTIELLENTVRLLEGTIDELRHEIDEKNSQINQLHTILALSQRNMETSQLALEDMRKKAMDEIQRKQDEMQQTKYKRPFWFWKR